MKLEQKNMLSTKQQVTGSHCIPAFKQYGGVLAILEGFDDFTIASSWERFIVRTETILREWQNTSLSHLLALGTKVDGVPKLCNVHRELPYGTKFYGVDYFFEAVTEGGSREEWTDGLHPLQLLFGVRDFLVVSPMSMSCVVLDAPEATLLLSTMAIALSNCGSEWPAFVPVHDPTRKAYQGIKGTRTHSACYEADRMGTQIPITFMHVEGLYNLFISKVANQTARSPPVQELEVEITMQLTYRTPMPGFEYLNTGNAEPIADYDGEMLEDFAWDDNCAWAEWHSVEDPVKGFELMSTWTNRIVRNSKEMAEYENLSTMDADKWSLTLAKIKDHKQKEESGGFSARLKALVQAFHVASEAPYVEDFAADMPSIKHITHSLTVPPPTVLDRILKDIFQEAPLAHEAGQIDHEFANGIKGAPPDSLFSRFCLHALRFGTCNIRAIAVLWIEFVREVRWCWDEMQPLPRVFLEGAPDLGACLLHQKLQLLLLCIEAEKANQRGAESESDEFQISHVFHVPTSETTKDGVSRVKSVQEHDEGRKGSAGALGELTLLNCRRSLHAPITQIPPVMTEDMLEEREQAWATLRNSPWENLVRTRYQHDILASDMAAFKAANPGAVLEDFSGWYSLRDQVDSDKFPEGDTHIYRDASVAIQAGSAKNGVAQECMSEIDKVRIWESVDACAARDQKPLFDHIREAEKVLHYMDNVRPQQLLAQMLACSFVAAFEALQRSVINLVVPALTWELEELFLSMEAVLPSSEKLSKTEQHMSDSVADWHNKLLQLCTVFERVERNTILAVSLGKKLGSAPRLLAALTNHHLEPIKVPTTRVIVKKWSTTDEAKDQEPQNEREVVAGLFPPLTPSRSWNTKSCMGQFLNGHEPHVREVIFGCSQDSRKLCQSQDRAHRGSPNEASEQALLSERSHRMYICGTLNDMQVALRAVPID